jgi:aspartyl protease family protein
MNPLPVITHDQLVLFAAVAGVFALFALLRRIPVIGTIVSVATWIALAGALAMLLGQREKFDPVVGQLAAMLNLSDDQKVVGEVTRVPMSRDGHFWVRATINGVERRMLVDSGATVTALSQATASAAGIDAKPSPFPMLIRTANGTISAETGDIPEMRMGNIVARDLAVVVSPAFGNADILGMNFLSRLKSWRVEGRTLILVPNHPQSME